MVQSWWEWYVWTDNKGELLLNLTLDYNINKIQEGASVVGDAAYLFGHLYKKKSF